MGKGKHGESLREVVQSILQSRKVLSYSKIVREIKKRGSWADYSIYQVLTVPIRNLVPAKHRWQAQEHFLFLRGDGRYELYNPRIHPKVIE